MNVWYVFGEASFASIDAGIGTDNFSCTAANSDACIIAGAFAITTPCPRAGNIADAFAATAPVAIVHVCKPWTHQRRDKVKRMPPWFPSAGKPNHLCDEK
mmetsp:Transcript_14062/g.25122  ORF Transcript_14062/g.25122 Transcript_14062/m.25122 type:complete len:100 (+) Transcript_14062:105-404(+)